MKPFICGTFISAGLSDSDHLLFCRGDLANGSTIPLNVIVLHLILKLASIKHLHYIDMLGCSNFTIIEKSSHKESILCFSAIDQTKIKKRGEGSVIKSISEMNP